MPPTRHPILVTLACLFLLGCATAAPRPSAAPTPAQAKPPAPKPTASPPPLPAAVAPAPGSSPLPYRLELVTGELREPTYVTHARDGSGRLFVTEKRGRIFVLRPGAAQPKLFLDLRPLVLSAGPEQGLFSAAFHPRYTSNGAFFVHYTNREAEVTLARYRASPSDPDAADPDSGATLLRVEKRSGKHNGGQLAFGPDGYLYASLGDGGVPGDPDGNAQNKGALLGKILRLDVDHGSPYAIPPDNPFVDEPGARPEVWAYGLRNPWRFSFDRATGDLYIADVGYNEREEVNVLRAGSKGGLNYGWNEMEGSRCHPPKDACSPAGFERPVAEYEHALGCSITGGYVYRGPSFPQLGGLYLFGDFCSGRLWTLREQAPGAWQQQDLGTTRLPISSFGEDEAGELYLTSLSGGLYRLTLAP